MSERPHVRGHSGIVVRPAEELKKTAHRSQAVAAYRPRDSNREIVFDEALATGAVITGRRTGNFAGYRYGSLAGREPAFDALRLLGLHGHVPPSSRTSASAATSTR